MSQSLMKIGLIIFEIFSTNPRRPFCLLPLSPNRVKTIRIGGVFHQARGFLSITLKIIKVHSPNVGTFQKFNAK